MSIFCSPLSTGNLAFPEFFSDCSVEQLADFMARAQPNCLSKPPGSVKTIAVAPPCGNRLLDAGEECDCGTVEVKLVADKTFSGCYNRKSVFFLHSSSCLVSPRTQKCHSLFFSVLGMR